MKSIIRVAAAIVVCGSLVVACSRERVAEATGADAVYMSGSIYTVDPARSWAEAVAIEDGRIAFVGSDSEAKSFIGSNTAVVDLHGRMMLPAFQDSHIHPIYGGMEAAACDLNATEDLAGYRSIIGSFATANPDLPWILGGGWSMAVFGPGGSPSRSILDELVPDRPVYLTSSDGHSGWANSVALDIAGITKDTPDPADGIIDRDPETGEPIGSLQEGAMDLVTAHIPPATLETRVNGLRYAMNMLHGYGVTSMQEAMANPSELEAYEAMDNRGELDLHVVVSLWWDRNLAEDQIDDLLAQREKFSKGHVDANTVKIMQDGVMENYTAVMLEPYLVPSGTRGIPMVEPEFLKTAVTLLDAEGFQVHFHAIGDGAVRQSLDAIEVARTQNGPSGNRHHISHLQIIHPDDIARFAGLEVVANFQPLWAYADDYVTELTIPFIGEERGSWMYPIKSVIDAGGMIAFGSDWSVSTANPFPQIETAITRVDVNTHDTVPLNPEQSIDIATALEAFTINAAFVNRQEDETGSIETGKLADLIVIDQNLFEIEAQDISDTKVLLTLFEGRPVHGDPATL